MIIYTTLTLVASFLMKKDRQIIIVQGTRYGYDNELGLIGTTKIEVHPYVPEELEACAQR